MKNNCCSAYNSNNSTIDSQKISAYNLLISWFTFKVISLFKQKSGWCFVENGTFQIYLPTDIWLINDQWTCLKIKSSRILIIYMPINKHSTPIIDRIVFGFFLDTLIFRWTKTGYSDSTIEFIIKYYNMSKRWLGYTRFYTFRCTTYYILVFNFIPVLIGYNMRLYREYIILYTPDCQINLMSSYLPKILIFYCKMFIYFNHYIVSR